MVCCQDYGQLEELGIGTESVDEDDLEEDDPRVRFAIANRRRWNRWAEAVNSYSVESGGEETGSEMVRGGEGDGPSSGT